MGEMAERVQQAGRQAHESDWFDNAIRFGLVAYGVVNLVLAWLAFQLAFGESSGQASSSGAVRELAQQPFGEVLVWLVALGMFVLVLWRLLDAFMGHRDEDGAKRLRKRLGSFGKAVIYGLIGFSALQIATGSGSKGGSSDSLTRTVMDLPAGQWIVAGIGLGIIGYGVSQLVRAYTEKFRKHLSAEGKSGESGRAYVLFGKVGYTAKGIAIGIVGGLFVYAGVTHEAQKSGGVDVALQKVLEQPFGPFLLAAIAVGIGCYGLFCLARARHLSR